MLLLWCCVAQPWQRLLLTTLLSPGPRLNILPRGWITWTHSRGRCLIESRELACPHGSWVMNLGKFSCQYWRGFLKITYLMWISRCLYFIGELIIAPLIKANHAQFMYCIVSNIEQNLQPIPILYIQLASLKQFIIKTNLINTSSQELTMMTKPQYLICLWDADLKTGSKLLE